MAHEIDFTTGKAAIAIAAGTDTPWHGLGQTVDPAAGADEWAKAGGLEWEAFRSPVEFFDTVSCERKTFNDKHVLYRTDCGAPLSVVSADYNIVQPAEILGFFGQLADAKHFTIETVGALMGGRRIWALGRVGDNARILDDEVAPYLLLATSYDGTMATLARFTTIRVVCHNTLQAAMRNNANQKQVTISHQAIFDAAGVRADLGIALDAWDEFQANATTMARRKITASDVDAYLQELFEPFMPYGQTYTPEQVRNSKGYRRIIDLFHGEMIGGDQEAAKGTLWGLLNATTEYIDHEKGRIKDTRLNAAWFGPGARFKDHAYQLAEKLVA